MAEQVDEEILDEFLGCQACAIGNHGKIESGRCVCCSTLISTIHVLRTAVSRGKVERAVEAAQMARESGSNDKELEALWEAVRLMASVWKVEAF